MDKDHEQAGNLGAEAGPGATHRIEDDGTTVQLARVLETYIAEQEAGRAPNREKFLADHAQFGPQLEQALAGLEFIQKAASAPPTPPVQLGDFRIVREVGRGGMGVVYEAEQISLKRRVALKVLLSGPVADEVAMQRFQREAETVGRLHHTNIVPIFAIGAEQGVRYYAMQFIEGYNLGVLAREGEGKRRRPVREIADWGLQAAEALAHAHQRGVIHRDIKPSNLILDPEGRIWLTDFGLARRVDDISLSVTGALLGTPRYMSPEQAAAAARSVDHRTDIYSLGATLYELATGQPIFSARTAHEVISQILHSEPKPPRKIAPELPRDFETIILKCLAKEPERRYPTAHALADDLRAFLAGRPLQARRARVPERMVRWVRLHRRLVLTSFISATVSLLVLAGGYFAWQRYRQASLGRIMLHAGQQNLLAEVLDAEDHAVTPLLALPTENPVELPAGAYQVRVSAPGLLSETWALDVVRGACSQPSVRLAPHWLFPPLESPADLREQVELVAIGGTTDLLILMQPTPSPGSASTEPRLRLVSGATGRNVWPQDLVFNDATMPPGGQLEEWRRLCGWSGVAGSFRNTGVAERVRDLDGDGTGDLVLVSRSSPSLLAISGATGQVLWWHRALPRPLTANPLRLGQAGRGALVGMPAVTDADGDGVADFVACFHSSGDELVAADGTRSAIGAQSWIEAISGRAGVTLWRQVVDGPWENYTSTSTDAAKYDSLCRPTVLRLRTREVVMLAVGAQWLGWDVKTGAVAWSPIQLGQEPFGAPRAIDLGGDRGGCVLSLHRVDGPGIVFELVAHALPNGTERWRKVLQKAAQLPSVETGGGAETLYSVADLNHDGRPEIIVATGCMVGFEGRWAGVAVIDGLDGRTQWEERLWSAPYGSYSESYTPRLIVGPDLDQDGASEVFTAWPGPDALTGKPGLWVAALSGAKGVTVWKKHHAGAGAPRSLAWWQPGTDGWPLLLVPIQRVSGGRELTLILGAGTGRVQHTLLDVNDARVADCDGDGVKDLFYPQRSSAGTRWAVVKGRPGETWRRFGEWQAAWDVDRDGWTDLVGIESGSIMARSGRDGRRLWSTQAEFSSPASICLPAHIGADARNAGVPLAVASVTLMRQTEPATRHSYRSLAAFSGQDGRRLWTAKDFDLGGANLSGSMMGWAYEYPYLECVDIDADGIPETLVATPSGDRQLQLTILAGRDGRILWRAPIVQGSLATDPRPAGPPFADFNRDGVLDLALILAPSATNGPERSCRVQVLDGQTGRPLWPAAFPLTDDERNLGWPEPTLGDLDGDGVPEVAVVRHNGFDHARNGYVCDLIVLDGRSGQVRWTWTWLTGSPELWPPVFLKRAEKGAARFCLGVREKGSPTLIALDAGGMICVKRPVQIPQYSFRPGSFVWRSLDLDGDGDSELLYYTDGHLCAAGGRALEVRWQRRLDVESFRLLDLVQTTGALSPQLVLWAGGQLLGLEARSGATVWQGPIALEPFWGGSDRPDIRLLRHGAGFGSETPRFQVANTRVLGSIAVVSESWPVAQDGRYLLPRREPASGQKTSPGP